MGLLSRLSFFGSLRTGGLLWFLTPLRREASIQLYGLRYPANLMVRMGEGRQSKKGWLISAV
jgi:hypothetical protein